MKQLKKVLVCLVCALCICGLVAQPVEAAKKSITLKATTATVKVGSTTTIKIKNTKGLKNKKVTYKSSNKKIATVTSKGVVKGIKAGTATITITSKEDKSVKAKFKVKVVKKSSTDFFKKNKFTIRKVGQKYKQKGYISSAVYANDKSRCMYSSNTTVKYSNVKKYNSKYDLIELKVTTKVPVMDGYGSINFRYNIHDTKGVTGYIGKEGSKVKKSKGLQVVLTAGSWSDMYMNSETDCYFLRYTTFQILLPKNKGAYFMLGGYDSVKMYEKYIKDKESAKEGGYQMKKSDKKKNYNYFYISAKDAKKALGK